MRYQQDKTTKNSYNILPEIEKNILKLENFNFKALREFDSVIFKTDKFITTVK